jgi:hypothetical protein
MTTSKSHSSSLIKAIIKFLQSLLEKGETTFNWSTHRKKHTFKEACKNKDAIMALLVKAHVVGEKPTTDGIGRPPEDYEISPKVRDLQLDVVSTAGSRFYTASCNSDAIDPDRVYEREEREAIIKCDG